MKAAIVATVVAAVIVTVLYLADGPAQPQAPSFSPPTNPLPTFKVQ